MTYKIINPPANLPAKFKPFVIDKQKYQLVYESGKKFQTFAMNMDKYNKATQLLMSIIIKVLSEDEPEFTNIFLKYCHSIIITSMDRPHWKHGSHTIPDKAVDFALYPYFLNPYLHVILNKYKDKYNFNIYLSLNNHHMHFATSEKPTFGFEAVYIPSENKIGIPKSPLRNFNKELSTGEYNMIIVTNVPVLASSVMDYYGMASIVPPNLIQNLANARPIYDYVKEGETIVRETSEGYGITYKTFINYLKAIGMYSDMYDFIKETYTEGVEKIIGGLSYLKKK